MSISPYKNKPQNKWKSITTKLVNRHPLKTCLVEIVLKSWDSIFDSKLGDFYIGKEIFPQPQVMGFFLHELIALNISLQNNDYCRGNANNEKDIHCKTNDLLGIEIKTSSHKDQIFANRSYAQAPINGEKKQKDGYFLAINFEKFNNRNELPQITLIRFGYLEHSDWIGQDAQTGQQAHLLPETYDLKFVELFRKGQE